MSKKCSWCDEEVKPGEESKLFTNHECFPYHQECAFRQIIGSLGHVKGTCSCKGGAESDPPGVSRREQAKAALTEWQRRNPPLNNPHAAQAKKNNP